MTTMRTGFITAEPRPRPARHPAATALSALAPAADRGAATLGSLQALALAVAASVIVTGLMWLVL